MEFIQCKNCETIIAIKDLKIPFSKELLTGANASNTIKGNDLCADCAEGIEGEEEEISRLEREVSK